MMQATAEKVGFAAGAEHIRELVQRATKLRTADAFETLENQLRTFDKILRESLQDWSADDVERIAEKLETGGTLNSDEIQILREVVVGNADQTDAANRNIETWMAVLTDLSESIGELTDQARLDAAPKVRSAVQNALRLLPQMRRYAGEQDRLERFDNAVSDLSPTARRVLAESLRVRLEQPDH
jgi:hypothetical protein